jgi:hypothetical protein
MLEVHLIFLHQTFREVDIFAALCHRPSKRTRYSINLANV